MKQLLLLTLCSLLFACGLSTEQRLTEAVKRAENADFLKQDEQVESLKVDSVKYTAISLKKYYDDLQMGFFKGMYELGKTRLDLKELTGEKLENIDSINRLLDIRFKTLDSLKKAASIDTTLYKVSYQLSAKTNKNSYNTTGVKYFRQSDWAEIKE